MSNRVQIGVIAERDKDGNFLPAQPLYSREDKKMKEQKEKLENEVADFFADAIRHYINGCKKSRINIYD